MAYAKRNADVYAEASAMVPGFFSSDLLEKFTPETPISWDTLW